MKPNVIIIHPIDNVAITLEDIPKGEKIFLPDGAEMTTLEDIAYSHKVLLKDVSKGDNIFSQI